MQIETKEPVLSTAPKKKLEMDGCNLVNYRWVYQLPR